MPMKFSKRSYFDRGPVIAALGRATAGRMARMGGLVRTIMQRSMRKRKKPSPAGEPPSSHQGDLRKFVEFLFDAARKSVVIGPVLRTGKGTKSADGKPLPQLLNEGGKVLVRGILDAQGTFVPLYGMNALSRQNILQKMPHRVVYRYRPLEARPFVAPALAKAKDKLAKQWQGAVRK